MEDILIEEILPFISGFIGMIVSVILIVGTMLFANWKCKDR